MFKKKKNKKEKKELVKLSDNKILVRVYKNFGSNTSMLKAEYLAEEKRDIYNNLLSINEQYKHNEETDFLMEDIYREMQIILEFSKKSREERLKLLQTKVEKQDRLIKILNEHIEINSLYNFADESLKARDYKILQSFIKNHDENGAYFTIEKGMRVYSFEAVDGFLVPIWYGVDTYSKYPDHTRKVKINIQEEQRMRYEMREFNKEKRMGQVLTLAIILTIVAFLACCFLGYKLLVQWEENEQKIHENAFICADYTSKVNKQFTELMENTVIKKLLTENQDAEIKQEEKDLSPENILKVLK